MEQYMAHSHENCTINNGCSKMELHLDWEHIFAYFMICCWPPSVSRDNGLCAHSMSVRVAASPAVTVQSDV